MAEDGQALRSAVQPVAVGAVRKPRPTQGQRQVQVILGGVEPVQQIGVPGRRHPRRLLRVGLAETIRDRCRAAGGICARAARPARGRPDARFRRRDRRPAGTGNAAPRQAGRAYAPATPGRGRQNTIAAPARMADCGEGNFVVDVAPLAGPFVDDRATHPDPAVRAVEGRHLEGDGESVVGARTSSCRQRGRGRHPGWRRPGSGAGCRARTCFRPERGHRFAWAIYYQIVATASTTANIALATTHWACMREFWASMTFRLKAGSGLAVAACFSKPSEPCHSATFVHRLAETFVRVADQVDRAVPFAAVCTGVVGLQPDHFVAVYGFRRWSSWAGHLCAPSAMTITIWIPVRTRCARSSLGEPRVPSVWPWASNRAHALRGSARPPASGRQPMRPVETPSHSR